MSRYVGAAELDDVHLPRHGARMKWRGPSLEATRSEQPTNRPPIRARLRGAHLRRQGVSRHELGHKRARGERALLQLGRRAKVAAVHAIVAHRRRGGHHAGDVFVQAERRVGLYAARHVAAIHGEPLRFEGRAVELARLSLFLTRGLGGREIRGRRCEPLEDVRAADLNDVHITWCDVCDMA